MSRPSTEHYDLAEAEKRDIIKCIETGKPLPERYRFPLFEDKREVELDWNGKSRKIPLRQRGYIPAARPRGGRTSSVSPRSIPVPCVNNPGRYTAPANVGRPPFF